MCCNTENDSGGWMHSLFIFFQHAIFQHAMTFNSHQLRGIASACLLCNEGVTCQKCAKNRWVVTSSTAWWWVFLAYLQKRERKTVSVGKAKHFLILYSFSLFFFFYCDELMFNPNYLRKFIFGTYVFMWLSFHFFKVWTVAQLHQNLLFFFFQTKMSKPYL